MAEAKPTSSLSYMAVAKLALMAIAGYLVFRLLELVRHVQDVVDVVTAGEQSAFYQRECGAPGTVGADDPPLCHVPSLMARSSATATRVAGAADLIMEGEGGTYYAANCADAKDPALACALPRAMQDARATFERAPKAIDLLTATTRTVSKNVADASQLVGARAPFARAPLNVARPTPK